MSSQRSRAPRGGARASSHNTEAEEGLWTETRDKIQSIARYENRAQELLAQITEMEARFKTNEAQGKKPTIEEIDSLSSMYRENVRIAETMASLLDGTGSAMEKITVLRALVTYNEENPDIPTGRGSNSRDSHSRSAMDYDGPADSPGPSPAENKQVRKLGGGRPSSQPPKDHTPMRQEPPEANETSTSRTKITFALGAEVAFKPKIAGQTEEHDWIQGIVVKVIGEGKSRRYDVQDPYPDEGKTGETYRSSASSMVTIPPLGSSLHDYEVGKRVLALYPDTTTFYRAEVKAMLEGGSKVKLLFEDDGAGVFKEVERRFVLDHKG
ncbi:hypothetical protein B7494_g5645 [Chlorociboria aeruginascens]|nr:hypothetical protein B7494_g5645 [Chlorociboria aeruginascens]